MRPSNCDASHVANLDDPNYGLVHDLSLPANEVPAFNWITPEQLQRRPRRHLPGQQPLGGVQRQRHTRTTPRPAFRPTTPRRRRRPTTPVGCTPPTCSCGTTSRSSSGPRPSRTAAWSTSPSTRPTRRSPSATASTTCPPPATAPPTRRRPTSRPTGGRHHRTGRQLAVRRLRDARRRRRREHQRPQRQHRADRSQRPGGDQQRAAISFSPGPGASGFIDRPTGLAGESPYLSGSPGTASEPALVAPGSSMVNDPKINADDTGRLVSGTDAPATRYLPTPSSEPSSTPGRAPWRQTPARRRRRTTTPSRGPARSSSSTTAASPSRCPTASTAT